MRLLSLNNFHSESECLYVSVQECVCIVYDENKRFCIPPEWRKSCSALIKSCCNVSVRICVRLYLSLCVSIDLFGPLWRCHASGKCYSKTARWFIDCSFVRLFVCSFFGWLFRLFRLFVFFISFNIHIHQSWDVSVYECVRVSVAFVGSLIHWLCYSSENMLLACFFCSLCQGTQRKRKKTKSTHIKSRKMPWILNNDWTCSFMRTDIRIIHCTMCLTPRSAFHWIGMWICISKYEIIINTVYLFFFLSLSLSFLNALLCACMYRRFYSRIKYA